jgi:DNA-binding transcriptional MerR regulator
MTLHLPQGQEDGMSDTRLSFKDMCARFDVTPRTLRYYEYIELLRPEKDGRARYYGPREVARMTLILRGRRFGFSLEEIRQWLEIYQKQGTAAQLAAFVAMADRQMAELDRQMADLTAARADLDALRAEALRGIAALDGAKP